MKKNILFFIFLAFSSAALAEDGYRLWLRYDKIDNSILLQQYRNLINSFVTDGSSPTLRVAKKELLTGLQGLLGKKISEATGIKNNSVILFTKSSSRMETKGVNYDKLGDEGFAIFSLKGNIKNVIAITANTDIGVLYGVFYFLRLVQTQRPISDLNITSSPKLKIRILNHWDNLNRTVERGYAGFSIWNWHTLPGYIDQRYIDYARANASVSINATVLTNVNANATILTRPWLEKVKALADVFRPYGIKVYLTARFSAPIEIGKLKSAGPLDDSVQSWWKEKAKEIYSIIPDFGGFLVKANSEGQPGPQDYKRNHADGANMLAEALAPHDGIVMWRAFVYSSEKTEDRARQAYSEFVPLDGKFADNVLVQVKNGPIDFQPREPFSPLFGAMPKTPLMMEFQITKEYLGFATHLAYLAPLYEEVLDADTMVAGKGSTVAKVIDGELHGYKL